MQKERQRALDRCAMIMHSSYFNQNKKAGQASTAAAAAVIAAAAAASAQNNSVRRELFSAPDSAQQNKARGAAPTEKQQLPVPSLFRTYSEMHSFHNDREAFLKHIRKFDLSVLLVPPHMRRRTLSCDSSGSRKGSRRELDLSLHAYVKNFTVSTRILSLKVQSISIDTQQRNTVCY